MAKKQSDDLSENKQNKLLITVLKVLFTIFCILISLFWTAIQLGFLVLRRGYFINYIFDYFFYAVNCLIVIFMCLAILFWFSRKGKFRIMMVAAAFILLQSGMAFVIPSNRTFLSVSPNGKNIFEMKQNRHTGILSYERNIYYFLAEQTTAKLPRPSVGNAYLGLSQTQENLEYAGAKNYKMSWIESKACVFTYQTEDGSYCQYVRGYGKYAQDNAWESSATQVIGNWKGENSSLKADGATYQLKIGKQSYTFDPTYSKALNDNLSVYNTSDGEAVCTILVYKDKNEDKDRSQLWVVPADSGKVYKLEADVNNF